jgi:hypothetical protein
MRQFKIPSKDSACRYSALRLTVYVLLPVLLFAGCATGKVSQKYPGLMYQTVNSASYPVLYPVLQDAAREGLPPMQVTFNGADAPASDYHLDLAFNVRVKGLHDTEAIWTVTTLLLLGMYPATCGHFEYVLTARLDDKDGRHLRSWQVIENDTAFTWLLMTPGCDGPDEEASQKIAASLLTDLYADMAGDPVFAGTTKPGAAVYPVVFIEATEDTQAVVERAVWSEMPFPGATFEPEARSRADRLLRIEIEYVALDPGVGSMIGRISTSILTIGLVSPCPPNTIVVRASVRDSAGQVRNTYEYKDKVRSSMLDNCMPAPVGMHPEAETKLLKRMFRTIAQDL